MSNDLTIFGKVKMTKRKSIVLLACIFLLTASISIMQTQRLAQAQLIDINVDGVRRIIGDIPQYIDQREYRVRSRWVPRSLAVYLNGKRLQRRVDYTVEPVRRAIIIRDSVGHNILLNILLTGKLRNHSINIPDRFTVVVF